MAMSLRFISKPAELLLAATFEDGSLIIWSVNQSEQPIMYQQQCFTDPGLFYNTYHISNPRE